MAQSSGMSDVLLPSMSIDRVLYPVTSLGPGRRVAIWTIGCDKGCARCANPELWYDDLSKRVEIGAFVQTICDTIGGQPIEGVTITGGEPLRQIEALARLLPLLREISGDILIYTGYTFSEAEAKLPGLAWEKVKALTSVFIDGEYIDRLNDNLSPLIGSTNQTIRIMDQSLRGKYETYLARGRLVQNVYHGDRMISVGIHNTDRGQGHAIG